VKMIWFLFSSRPVRELINETRSLEGGRQQRRAQGKEQIITTGNLEGGGNEGQKRARQKYVKVIAVMLVLGSAWPGSWG